VILKNLDLAGTGVTVPEEVMFFMNSFPKIFNGDMVTKSADKDVYAKKRWVSINPYTRQLHWSKSESAANTSKFISLANCASIEITSPNNTGNGVLRIVSSSDEVVILEVSNAY